MLVDDEEVKQEGKQTDVAPEPDFKGVTFSAACAGKNGTQPAHELKTNSNLIMNRKKPA